MLHASSQALLCMCLVYYATQFGTCKVVSDGFEPYQRTPVSPGKRTLVSSGKEDFVPYDRTQVSQKNNKDEFVPYVRSSVSNQKNEAEFVSIDRSATQKLTTPTKPLDVGSESSDSIAKSMSDVIKLFTSKLSADKESMARTKRGAGRNPGQGSTGVVQWLLLGEDSNEPVGSSQANLEKRKKQRIADQKTHRTKRQIDTSKYSVDPSLQPPMAKLQNNCQRGHVEPIWEGSKIFETYCRCPDNSYGKTCMENFANPCLAGGQYFPADPSLGTQYFIECGWGLPFLFKCPFMLVWNQQILTCDWPPRPNMDQAPPAYGQPAAPVAPAYGQPAAPIAPAPAPAPYQTYSQPTAPVIQPPAPYAAPAQVQYNQPPPPPPPIQVPVPYQPAPAQETPAPVPPPQQQYQQRYRG